MSLFKPVPPVHVIQSSNTGRERIYYANTLSAAAMCTNLGLMQYTASHPTSSFKLMVKQNLTAMEAENPSHHNVISIKAATSPLGITCAYFVSFSSKKGNTETNQKERQTKTKNIYDFFPWSKKGNTKTNQKDKQKLKNIYKSLFHPQKQTQRCL